MHLHNQTELLRLDDIRVALKEGKRRFTAVNGVSVSICAGRNLGIIGESGCGKTLLCHCILGLLDQDEWETEGSILFEGHRIIAGKDGVRPGFCGTAAGFIAQDPAGAFDPRMTFNQDGNPGARAGTEKLCIPVKRRYAAAGHDCPCTFRKTASFDC